MRFERAIFLLESRCTNGANTNGFFIKFSRANNKYPQFFGNFTSFIPQTLQTSKNHFDFIKRLIRAQSKLIDAQLISIIPLIYQPLSVVTSVIRRGERIIYKGRQAPIPVIQIFRCTINFFLTPPAMLLYGLAPSIPMLILNPNFQTILFAAYLAVGV